MVDAIAVVAASLPVAVVAARAYIGNENVNATEAAAEAAAADADAAAAAAAASTDAAQQQQPRQETDARPKAKTRVVEAHRQGMAQRACLTFWSSFRTLPIREKRWDSTPTSC